MVPLTKDSILIDVVVALNLSLHARNIPGKMNAIADDLFRAGQNLLIEWSLVASRDCITSVCSMGTSQSRSVCSQTGNQVCDFISPTPNSRTLEVDALTMEWEGVFAYAFPHSSDHVQVLKFNETKTCSLILIAPFWSNHMWFPV